MQASRNSIAPGHSRREAVFTDFFKVCVPTEQSAAICCTSVTLVTLQKEACVPPEQSAAIVSTSASVEPSGSVSLVTSTMKPRTLAPRAFLSIADELIKDILSLSTIPSALPQNERLTACKRRFMKFQENNAKAINHIMVPNRPKLLIGPVFFGVHDQNLRDLAYE